jgi:hypothetical protein
MILEEEVDSSWLETLDTPKKYFKTDMQDINIFYIYINKASTIFKIEKEKYALEKQESKMVLKKEVLMKAIQTKRNPEPKIKYKLKEVIAYSINVNPDEIPDYINHPNENAEKNITHMEMIEDLVFPACLPIFHKVNSCFIILEEMVLVLNNKKPVSILKKENTNDKKKTKKVRISPDTPIKESKSKTEKAR